MRLVLLAVGEFMDQEGRNAYPGIDTIVRASGLRKRTVQMLLLEAVKLGWLLRTPDSRPGRRGWHWTYAATVPAWLHAIAGRSVERLQSGAISPHAPTESMQWAVLRALEHQALMVSNTVLITDNNTGAFVPATNETLGITPFEAFLDGCCLMVHGELPKWRRSVYGIEP